ncbi:MULTISPECIES: hypothetical protein [Mycobacteriaceae]|jgi:hypothetical protein|uniref:hypothetical protein n=1 Tax=Mycobacteriaceae TaxID=1762 RepID=UPI0009FDCBB7|nr:MULTISPECIES: hypothetical protein [Mycobacteriaceae]MBU8840193.1 hypothetical protein [Mycolicibacterium goodii]UCN12576.1 hypothetical protein LFT50_29215 [Mycobacterium intracellulare subsp. chimaera]
MASITKYVLVGTDDVEQDYEYDSCPEAIEAAKKQGCAVIEREYVYDDSSLVWTPDGSDRWPPSRP